jgi:hypothetical protein
VHTPIFLFFKQLSVFTSLLVLVSVMVTGCSSSDDDGDVVGIPGTVPNLLNYEISQASGVFMTLAVNPEATVSSMLLNGTLDRTSEIITLNAQTLPAMVVSAAGFLISFDPSFNDYQLRVISAATWTGDGDPTSGEFDIVSANELDTIKVKVNNTIPGVDVTYLPNGVEATSIPLTWQEFNDAFDNPQAGEEFAAVASFATSLLRFVYVQGDLVVQTLEFIGENSDLMEAIGTVEDSCDMFPANLPPDIIVANPGSFTVGWNDENNDISISSGDKVYLDFFECWVNEESDPVARLYNRGITFNNYTEVQSGNVITRVGFESPDGIVAGMVFDFLEITETEDNGINTVISSDNTITVSGGFSMVFTAP